MISKKSIATGLVVVAGLAAAFVFARPNDSSHRASELKPARSRVSERAISSLVVGADDMLFPSILFDVSSDNISTDQCWFGPPSRKNGFASYQTGIEIAVLADEAAALQRVDMWFRGCQVPIPEVTGNHKLSPFCDRLWILISSSPDGPACGAVGVMFTRGNVACSIFIGNPAGVDADQAYNLVKKIAHKIDMAAAGTPEPPVVLPPSVNEMGGSLKAAWDAKNIGKFLGTKQTTIAMKVGKRPRMAVPAGKIGKNDYMVPLSYLTAILGSRKGVSMNSKVASTTLAGKPVTFAKGKFDVKIAGKSTRMSGKAEFRGKQVFVPVSVVEKVVGHSIKWTKTGNVVTACV